jgi:trimethylamine--corrinoid protein Co-methyltransferase
MFFMEGLEFNRKECPDSMEPNTSRFHSNALEYFSAEQMRDIHSAALEILADCGTVIHNKKAVALLHRQGAFVKDDKRVFIPAGMVEWAIRRAPSRVTIYDRKGLASMFLEGRNVYYGTGSDCPYLLDSFSGERRDFLLRDVEDAVRLVDALPHIDFTMSMGLAPDVSPNLQYQVKYAVMIRGSIKPQVITAGDLTSLKDIVDIAAAAVGGQEELRRKPIFVLYDEPTSPLVHGNEAMEKLLFMAENGLPTNYSPGMMAGATGPVTMAGAIALANAEILTGLVVHQLANPGAPFVFGAGMSPMDLKSMQPTYSSPEAMMEQAGLCQIGRCLYDLPTWGFGGCSASKLADEQAVNEAGSYILMSGLMGTNLVHDVGYLEFGKTYSFDLLAMCDEIVGQVRRMAQGIRVDKEHLAVDVVKRVGPAGHFLSDAHTLDHFRDNWQPDLTDRRTYETWKAKGETTMGQRAKAKIRHILENHRPEPLPATVDAEIDAILERAKSRTSS